MRKKVLVFSVVLVLIVVAAGLGYVVGYVQGLFKVIDKDVRVHADVLLLESLSLARSSDIDDLIDEVEQNCASWASFIQANESALGDEGPILGRDTSERIAEALEAWQKAQKKLHELRALYLEEDKPNE